MKAIWTHRSPTIRILCCKSQSRDENDKALEFCRSRFILEVPYWYML